MLHVTRIRPRPPLHEVSLREISLAGLKLIGVGQSRMMQMHRGGVQNGSGD